MQVFSHHTSWEDKQHPSKHPPLPPSSPALYTEHDVLGSGISLWSVGVACPSSLLPAPPAAPSPLTSVAAEKTEKASVLALLSY